VPHVFEHKHVLDMITSLNKTLLYMHSSLESEISS